MRIPPNIPPKVLLTVTMSQILTVEYPYKMVKATSLENPLSFPNASYAVIAK